MASIANPLVSKRQKLRRALVAVYRWLEALDYNTGDYTLDRVDRLEREVKRLKEELRQVRVSMALDAPNGDAVALKE